MLVMEAAVPAVHAVHALRVYRLAYRILDLQVTGSNPGAHHYTVYNNIELCTHNYSARVKHNIILSCRLSRDRANTTLTAIEKFINWLFSACWSGRVPFSERSTSLTADWISPLRTRCSLLHSFAPVRYHTPQSTIAPGARSAQRTGTMYINNT